MGNLTKISCCTALLGFFATTAYAQEDFYRHCNALLQHGANNISSQLDEQSVEAFKWHRYCRADVSESSDSVIFEAEASILGFGSGSGGRNSSAARRSVSNWCEDNRDTYLAYQQNVQRAQTVSQDAMNAWNECQAVAQKGVNITPTIGGSPAKFADFTIDSTFDGDLYFLGINSPGWNCKSLRIQKDGTVKNLDEYSISQFENRSLGDLEPVLIANDNIQINCVRNDPDDVVISGVGSIKYTASNISINTSSVRMSVYFDEEPDTYFVTPPKSIIAFNSDRCPRGWREFEGAYGRFLRGIDKGGEIVTDPEKPNGLPRTAGHHQNDAIASHSHSQRFSWTKGHFSPSGWETVPFVTGNETSGARTASEGDAETRPKNVAVLFCERTENLGRLRTESESE